MLDRRRKLEKPRIFTALAVIGASWATVAVIVAIIYSETIMKKTMLTSSILACTLLAGCGLQQIRPSDVESHIDPISVTSRAQETLDVTECTKYANESVKKAQKRAIWTGILAGLAGAAVGSAIGNGTGYQANFAAADAAQFAGAGAVTVAAVAHNQQERIIYNCLVHRGYQLLY